MSIERYQRLLERRDLQRKASLDHSRKQTDMNELNDKQLNDEINALALYFSNRELHPQTVAAMCASACGEIIGRNRAAGIINDDTAERMLQTAFKNMRDVAYRSTDTRN